MLANVNSLHSLSLNNNRLSSLPTSLFSDRWLILKKTFLIKKFLVSSDSLLESPLTIRLDFKLMIVKFCSPSLEELSIHKNQLSEVPTAISSLARFSLKIFSFCCLCCCCCCCCCCLCCCCCCCCCKIEN